MKFRKILLSFLLLILILCGVCGCMNSGIARKIELAENYLFEKYRQEFHAAASIESSIDVPYDELFFETAACPGEKITVYCQKDGSGYSFEDNFYGYLIKDEYEKKIQAALGDLLKEKMLFFHFSASYFPAELDASYRLDDALRDYGFQLRSNIFILVPKANGEISEKLFSEIQTALKNGNINCYVAVYEISDDDYNSLDKDTYLDYLSSDYSIKPVYDATVR